MSLGGIEMLFVIFTKFSVVFTVLTNPPQDYASLFNTKAVLQSQSLEYNEDALIAFLKKGMSEISDADIKKAYEMLGSTTASERKAAQKTLLEAGLRSAEYLKRGLESNDPEIKDSSKALLAKIQKNSIAENSAGFLKKLYAVKALGELKSAKALPILKVYSTSTDVSVAEEAKIAAAICGGQAYKRRSGVMAVKELMTSVPSDAGLVAVLDFERGSKADLLSNVINALAADIGKGNPFVTAIEGKKNLLQNFAQMGLNFTGNVRIDAATAYISKNVGPNEGYFCLMVKGLFDKTKIENLLEKSGLKKESVNGVNVLYEREVSMCFPDKDTFIFTASDRDSLNVAGAMLNAFKDKSSVPAKHLQEAFETVISQKSRLAVCGMLGERTLALLEKEISREIDYIRQRGRQSEETNLEMLTMEGLQNLIRSKYAFAWMDDKLQFHFEFQNDKAKKLAEQISSIDNNLRTFVANGVVSSLEKGRDDSLATLFLKDYDLSKSFAKTSAAGDSAKATVYLKSILNVFPITFFIARF